MMPVPVYYISSDTKNSTSGDALMRYCLCCFLTTNGLIDPSLAAHRRNSRVRADSSG